MINDNNKPVDLVSGHGDDQNVCEALIGNTDFVNDKPSLSVIFPAFNEVDNIAQAISEARCSFINYFDPIQFLVVDDGSTDGTTELIRKIAAEADDVVALHHPKNRGYGAALRTGIANSTNELIFFTDSDLQFDMNEIKHLREWIHGYELVAGYRVDRADPWHRRFNAWGWNMLVRVTLGVKVRDIDCAFKLFRADIFEQIQLTSIGAMVNTELLAYMKKLNMRLREVPVQHYPRTAGEQSGANLRVIIKALHELNRIFWVLRRK
ncbi:MAG: glycosyltransferase family 2 protein [Magnetococcales bacterium]|nr:glycosyltransferase family 2 protein [Magnetococcales bacterium]